MIKIGFISKRKPEDKKVWSGTTYRIFKSISSINNVEIVWIPAEDTFFRKLILMPIRLRSKLLRKNYSQYYVPVAKLFNKSINEKLLDQVDLLFVATQSLYFAYLNTDKPIFFLTDTTFKQIHNYYHEFTNFSNLNIKHSNLIHQRAYDKAYKIIAASDWTRDSLMSDYHIEPKKIEVIEFGANLDEKDIQNVVAEKKDISECLNVLFLGVDWERKGGAIAVDTVRILNEMGIKANLSIVGVGIRYEHQNIDYVTEYGFLDKRKEEDYKLLVKIVNQSHILLLPSKAECAGIVFCEASACGIPSFAYDTGGVSNYVINSKNGYLLDIHATGKDFAIKIKEVVYTNNELDTLSKSCQELYKEKLNWGVWTKKFEALLQECELPSTRNNKER